ncbi:MAG: hypothetical protein E7287_02855 [Lachnospiraceae bacterium]|nr:hypothetical protein [Lachnospiraceae bacterium]
MKREELFQFSMDNLIEIVVFFELSGTITYANKMAMERLEYEGDIYKCNIWDIFPGSFEIEGGVCHIKEELEVMQSMMAYRKNQTCFPVRSKIFRMDETTYMCIAYDATNEVLMERKTGQALQEAEDAMKVKTEFVANVTHELRTPVNGISGSARELLSMETDPAKIKLLQMVERGCKDMNSLINNILDFSKLEAGKFVLEPRSFEFRNMMDYVKNNHNNRILEKGLNFSISISPQIPKDIIGDELRIVQILNNLISNAYKFTSVGGIDVQVVKTAQRENMMELFFIVSDTGIGIAKANIGKLFQSFTQVDASISRRYGGTGLGLNITKQLVELMGGEIHVQSEEGKGTVFSFDIWVEIPKENLEAGGVLLEYGEEEDTDKSELLQKLQNLSESKTDDKIWIFGEQENLDELDKKLSKLILCVEMDNWEKAEMFSETVRQLLEGAPREIKSAMLKLKMAVQKENYEKVVPAYEALKGLLEA